MIQNYGENYGECLDCGYRDKVDEFPVLEEEELQGQIHCPKCNSENVEI